MDDSRWSPSPTTAVLLVVIVFAVAAGIGAIAHLGWLMIANNRALTTAMAAAFLVILWYLWRARRRLGRLTERRPVADLAARFTELEVTRREGKKAASAPEAEAALDEPDREGKDLSEPEEPPASGS